MKGNSIGAEKIPTNDEVETLTKTRFGYVS